MNRAYIESVLSSLLLGKQFDWYAKFCSAVLGHILVDKIPEIILLDLLFFLGCEYRKGFHRAVSV